jgi:hypothetical protein
MINKVATERLMELVDSFHLQRQSEDIGLTLPSIQYYTP